MHAPEEGRTGASLFPFKGGSSGLAGKAPQQLES
jgi:hypothetical protein